MTAEEIHEACQELWKRNMATGDRPHVAEITPLVVAYYHLPEGSMGGNLHVVLDDCNVEKNCVAWCQGQADARGDKAGSQLASVLTHLCSKKQRKAIANADDGRYD